MRSRAYRPEAPNSLEERSLLSGVTGPLNDPVILPKSRYFNVINQQRFFFQLYSRNHDIPRLLDHLRNITALIPFGRVDGLGQIIINDVFTMKQQIKGKVPHAIPHAAKAVIFATRAEVANRIQEGDVVLR